MKYFVLVFVILLSFCEKKQKVFNKTQADTLKFVKSVTGFKTPESVLFYSKKNLIFISNINGNPSAKDTNGFISVIDTSGKVKSLYWIKGLNAPKGMGVFDTMLYVTDITQLVEIDINKAKIVNKIEIGGSSFLNDIAVDKSGQLYISDTKKGIVYKYSNGAVSEYLKNLEAPNGLLIENDTLFVGCDKKLLKVSLVDNKIIETIHSPTSIDGLKKIDKTNFIISDWTGNINKLNSSKSELLISTVGKKNAADFEYIPQNKMLYVPTFFDNKIDVYHYEK